MALGSEYKREIKYILQTKYFLIKLQDLTKYGWKDTQTGLKYQLYCTKIYKKEIQCQRSRVFSCFEGKKSYHALSCQNTSVGRERSIGTDEDYIKMVFPREYLFHVRSPAPLRRHWTDLYRHVRSSKNICTGWNGLDRNCTGVTAMYSLLVKLQLSLTSTK